MHFRHFPVSLLLSAYLFEVLLSLTGELKEHVVENEITTLNDGDSDDEYDEDHEVEEEDGPRGSDPDDNDHDDDGVDEDEERDEEVIDLYSIDQILI